MDMRIFGSSVIVLIVALVIGYYFGKKNPTLFGLMKAA
jgi:hypothetical protein